MRSFIRQSLSPGSQNIMLHAVIIMYRPVVRILFIRIMSRFVLTRIRVRSRQRLYGIDGVYQAINIVNEI